MNTQMISKRLVQIFLRKTMYAHGEFKLFIQSVSVRLFMSNWHQDIGIERIDVVISSLV